MNYVLVYLPCRDPYSLNDSVHLKIPCLAEYGGPIDPTIALGGYSELYCCMQYLIFFIHLKYC